MSKRLALTLILILVIVNVAAAGFLFYRFKVSADEIATSATNAVTQKSANSKNGLPQTDVAGEDPAELGRYPGSMRTAFTKNENSTIIEYQSKDQANLVLGYYKSRLALANWILEDAGPAKIEFSRDNQKIIIEANADSKGITTYKITL